MDCCKYGEYRGAAHAQYGAGAGAGWEGYGYAPLPYPPYAHAYYGPPTHDPYARYYRYEYPTRSADYHGHHTDHAMPIGSSAEYGAYALKEARSRRPMARRDQRASAHHLPLPHTPPLECGINGRGPAYCEPQLWPHYQMGVPVGGWNGPSGAVNGSWASRGPGSREPMRYNSDCRLMKGSPNHQGQACAQEARASHYPVFEDSSYGADGGGSAKHADINEYSRREVTPSEANVHPARERYLEQREQRPCPPEEKRPPLVPLPAFQQAFGSTEIGKFAEAFSRAEAVHDAEDSSNDNFVYESFQDWDGPPELQWSTQPVSREIKCEDNY